MATTNAKNDVFRRPNPGKGQGLTQAISAATGWEYEHDETDAQIDAIEGLIAQVRGEEADKAPVAPNAPKRGDTFSWTSTTDEGEGVIRIGTTFIEPGDGTVGLGKHGLLEGHVWVAESWEINPDGKVRAA